MRWCGVFLAVFSFLLAGCATNANEERPFFQQEQETEAHGRKTLFDHVVEIDPGSFDVSVAPDYLNEAPARIAVLPFSDVGSANFVVDKVPLTHRNQQERESWAWTDAQRLRRSLDGYLSQREFLVENLNAVDAVLKARGIDTPEKLDNVPPQVLGRWLGVDAVAYGTVVSYDAFYLGLLSGWRVGVDVRIVSTRTGVTLVRGSGSRYDTSLLIALSLEDIAISSGENLLQLRDINLARTEEEACREIVMRIPHSANLQDRIEEGALDYAGSHDSPDVRGSQVTTADPPP
jgi:hypothetical protein